MHFLIKLFPEITIKSKVVRRRFVCQLRKNTRAVLLLIDPGIQVIGEWDKLEVTSSTSNPAVISRLIDRLKSTPGIAQIHEVEKHPLPGLDGILELTLAVYAESLAGKTFAVRCKRMGTQPFSSVEVERFVGAGLLAHSEARGVSLNNPDLRIQLEVRQDSLFIVKATRQGLGGFPLGGLDSVLSMLSGGFDSAVSSFHCIQRGLQTHYCFFSMGGPAHELPVKELALYLWMRYHSSHRVRFVTVPFETVAEELGARVHKSYRGVVLKRMMLRAADRVADKLGLKALVTGESIAQVASQTLSNLTVIDEVTDRLVLRPLVTTDKQEIIDTARRIGTDEFSEHVPEYCGVVSNNPTTKARPERLENEEARFDFDVLESAIGNARYQLIHELAQDAVPDGDDKSLVVSPVEEDVVIDIRHPSERSGNPLQLEAEVLAIPFYSLRHRFAELDDHRRYLLYCDRGMMSRLHAVHLRAAGHSNVAVLHVVDHPADLD